MSKNVSKKKTFSYYWNHKHQDCLMSNEVSEHLTTDSTEMLPVATEVHCTIKIKCGKCYVILSIVFLCYDVAHFGSNPFTNGSNLSCS